MAVATCYMCNGAATSDEHAPPRCIFPARKDTPNQTDYRRNLITVPSCDAHNNVKSHDDEYLLHVLAASYTSSNVGLTQFITKSARAFAKTPTKASSLIRRSESVQLQRVGDSSWEDGLHVIVEAERLDLVLGNCARALYFHETGRKLLGPLEVITAFTMYNDPTAQTWVTSRLAVTKSFLANHTAKGGNPDVFKYKFAEGEITVLFLIHFYSKSEVIVSLNKHVSEPVEACTEVPPNLNSAVASSYKP